jgi:hypothetical protein
VPRTIDGSRDPPAKAGRHGRSTGYAARSSATGGEVVPYDTANATYWVAFRGRDRLPGQYATEDAKVAVEETLADL